ncbi:PREDICTED: uncharacterized protein LOC107350507 [Acropora digitifera]|uniref:uncharacterized protein LOC107350507 n=1 Tax=Acropora digitifera TaxID=70779 RepID=UPI00077A0674|nr:PREDICTED: uncharacterized protein LOC107350507 [Acropora digitifera]
MKIFLFIVLYGVVTVFAQAPATISNCCSCEQFSEAQGKQLRGLLQEEASMLREGMQMMCPKKDNKWHKIRNITSALQFVCFSAKGDKPGLFTIDREGFVAAFKLVHVSGQVSCENPGCNSTVASYKSNWGCSFDHPYIGPTPLGTFITTKSKRVLFPREKFIRDKSKSTWYALPGFEPDSPFLVFHDFSNPDFFHRGQQLQLWYGEDLENVNEENNSGKTCVEVYAWYL